MLHNSPAFSSFSTDSAATAAKFYGEVLGLDVTAMDGEGMGAMVRVRFTHGATALIYEKEDHAPATHTVLMFPVDDATATARWLTERGVALERLEWCDDDGVARDPSGLTPNTAWFKDPAGNWLSILESDDEG
ncbi:VOC family protein [Demequina globuliformis]|uniref:VOC family protein n=1 Tax=Demequina globuliformis TaxID=676202 RepID=UPI0007866D44|nr:VOC family protein [Demequina globuliformis]